VWVNSNEGIFKSVVGSEQNVTREEHFPIDKGVEVNSSRL